MKNKNIIRVGDRVKIINPELVIRVGYPLSKIDMLAKQSPEQLKAIRDMFKAFGVTYSPETISDFGLKPSSPNLDRLYNKIRYAMAGEMLEQAGWGGNQRRIHTQYFSLFKNCWATVDDKRVVKTGDRYASSGGYDSWTGEYDYEPGGLSDMKTHVLYHLYVDGHGSVWSPTDPNGEGVFVSNNSEYKKIEIEGCNLIKIDPKNPPTDENEHPSGLSGEHSVVLDAIHQECLRNR